MQETLKKKCQDVSEFSVRSLLSKELESTVKLLDWRQYDIRWVYKSYLFKKFVSKGLNQEGVRRLKRPPLDGLL